MEQTIFIPGPLPGLNELLLAKGRMFPGGRGKRWNGYANIKKQVGETIYWHMIQAHLVPVRQARFRFVWCERDRRRDPDNVAAGGRKIIFDALVKAKILHDDGPDQIHGWEDVFRIDKDNPGCHVTIQTVGGK